MRRFFVLATLAFVTVPLAPAPGQPPRDRRVSESDLRYNALVDGWYRRYLRRPIGYYASESVAMLKSGTPQESMVASILNTPDYYALAGGDDRRFVARLVTDITGRAAAPREIEYLLDRMRREERNQVISEYLSLHPEGLQVAASRPEPEHEYRPPYERDHDHDRWDRERWERERRERERREDERRDRDRRDRDR